MSSRSASPLTAGAANPHQILSISFNQDYQCVSVGLTSGFRIYNVSPFAETFRREFTPPGGIGCVGLEMLFRSNILALIGGGRNPRYPPNKVMIWDDHQTRCIGELGFRTEVRRVRLRRDRIIVVLDNKIYLYNFADLKLLDQIETGPNPFGLCGLCAVPSSNVLVCPGLQPGHVRVEHFNLSSRPTTVIGAHESDLAAVALNGDGTLLASASRKGTLIRIWDTGTGRLHEQVRRGSDRASITSMAFNADSTFLVAASDKGTVHIFSIPPLEYSHRSSPPSAMQSVLPSYFSSSWSRSRFRIPPGSPAIVAFDSVPHTIMVVSMTGIAYKARFDPDQSGICQQISCVDFIGSDTTPDSISHSNKQV